jgi:hypothetical protein
LATNGKLIDILVAMLGPATLEHIATMASAHPSPIDVSTRALIMVILDVLLLSDRPTGARHLQTSRRDMKDR